MSESRRVKKNRAERKEESGISRRSLLSGFAAAAVAGLFVPARAGASRPAARGKAKGLRVAVVGAGAFGGWSALHLLRKGAKVTLVDSWGPGNSRASSGARCPPPTVCIPRMPSR